MSDKENNNKPVQITELVLRDGHQSLFATRMRIDDMLPIAEKLDQIGYWSMESWGGATFDACIRFLGEDPWERIREIKKVMPNTPQQMLLRAQNLLGYRHYSDDVVRRFVDRCADNGVGVLRILKLPLIRQLKLVSTLKAQFHIQLVQFILLNYGLIWLKKLKIWVPILYVLRIWLGYCNHM